MAQAGDTRDALATARRLLADRDADLADADEALAALIAGAHGIAVESIGRIAAIEDEIEAAATEQPNDTAAQGREIGRHLIAKNREIADVISAAREAVDAKTVDLRRLLERYRP